MARAFEEATIDKNEQEEKTIRMKKMLDTAGELRRVSTCIFRKPFIYSAVIVGLKNVTVKPRRVSTFIVVKLFIKSSVIIGLNNCVKHYLCNKMKRHSY